MMNLLVRHPARNADGDLVRNKKGNVVYEEARDAVRIPENALLVVGVESKAILEGVKQQFTRLANALGAKLDIFHRGEDPSDDYDPDEDPEEEADTAVVTSDPEKPATPTTSEKPKS